MVNYNAFVSELFSLEIYTTVYLIRDQQVFYDLPKGFEMSELLTFLSVDNHYKGTIRYNDKLTKLQRQAISEVRVLGHPQQRGILMDAEEHLETFLQLLKSAIEQEKMLKGKTLLYLDRTFLDSHIVPNLIVVEEIKIDLEARISLRFAERLRQLIEWKYESLKHFIARIDRGLAPRYFLEDGKELSARQRALLSIFKDEIIKRSSEGNNLYNHYLSLCKTSDRTGYANESWGKARNLLLDYEAVLPLLDKNQRKRAEDEMVIISSGRK